MNENSPEVNILNSLKNALGNECPECGEVNPADVIECQACGRKMPLQKEDEPQLSFVHNEGLGRVVSGKLEKVPMEKAANLAILDEAIEGLETGAIELSEYQKRVNKIKNDIEESIQLLKSDTFKAKVASLPQIQKKILNETEYLFEQYLSGLNRMLEYKGGGDVTPANEGFDMVEEALEKMDRVQDTIQDHYYEEPGQEKEEPVEEKKMI